LQGRQQGANGAEMVLARQGRETRERQQRARAVVAGEVSDSEERVRE